MRGWALAVLTLAGRALAADATPWEIAPYRVHVTLAADVSARLLPKSLFGERFWTRVEAAQPLTRADIEGDRGLSLFVELGLAF